MRLIPLLVAAVAGAAMAVQGSFNSVISKYIGLLEASLTVQALGAAAAGILLAVGLGKGELGHWTRVPWFLWLSGLLGLAITFGVALSIRRVGVAPATTAIVVAQILAAALIDHFGLFGVARMPFHLIKLVGVAFLGAGCWILLKY